MIAGSGIVIDSVLDMHRKYIRAARDHNDLFPLMETVLVPVGDAPVQFCVINPKMFFLKCDDVSPVRRHIKSPVGIIAASGDRFLYKCLRIEGQDRVLCQNIDFAPSSFDAGVNLRTTYGNVAIAELSGTYAEGYTIIKGFEFDTEQGKELLIYVESETEGALLKVGSNLTTIKDELTVTGEANGITMLDSAYNTFIFTNGVDYIAYCPDGNTTLETLNPEYDGNAVTGLAICEQDGSLVIGCNEGVVLASRKGDITDFDYVLATDTNKAWYQLFGKKVTAVVPYIDALLVFTEEDSTVLSGNMSDADTAKRADASLGGCMSYESWCKHDKYLFFYDNRQKNIYYYMQNDYGQKVLGEPVAPEVQKFFNDITKLQMVSYVGNKAVISFCPDNVL